MTSETDDAPKKGVRHSTYTQEMGDLICLRIMEGTGVRTMCKEEGMPAASTVFLWVLKHADFAKQYHEARSIQRDGMAEEITDIADEEISYGDPDVARAKLAHRDQRLKSRQWILTKLDDRFRERANLHHSGPNGGPIQVDDVSLTDAERAARIAAIIDAARARATGRDPEDTEDLGAAAGSADPGV